ncbi:acyl-CoA Delta-9 desaturase-like [Eupeodes corollae]|uniref:acyl-CoA Delta-9 desaturase-like n=1 Tax=Eupeodes corollae TaxID=290404 RepID=UPI00248F7B4C|nr:acyl-CoA Delta-9 desaturase-like [Eupeodes corollae]XP_055902591.1 acyl-CoA Delta-9 desaturase-like [Eupeodes corollae]
MSPETETILVHRKRENDILESKCPSTTQSSSTSSMYTKEENKTHCENLANGNVLDDSKNRNNQNSTINNNAGFIDKINFKEEAMHDNANQDIGTDMNFKREIVWSNAIGFLVLHILGGIGLVMLGFGYAKFQTVAYFVVFSFLSGMGITMGAHRLFSHKAYKAKTWLRVLLMLMHTMAGQNCLYVWVRDHRQHHKYSDTDADPHNATRGFFFSHVGWLMSKKHPKVKEYGQKIDMSDMEADPWIMFQKRHYKILYTIFTLVLPTAIPCLLWNETVLVSLFTTYFARYVVQLNTTWSVNSLAHMFGNKPYDKNILSVETVFVSIIAGGEGWHNYHHTFPWDYRTAELGMPFNVTTKVIDFFAKNGAVYDRKTVSENILRSRIQRTGDGSHEHFGEEAMAKKANGDIDEGSKIDSNGLRKYIVEKNRINKMMIDELGKLNQQHVSGDDLNNNNSSFNKSKLNINDLAKSTSTSINNNNIDKQALNV